MRSDLAIIVLTPNLHRIIIGLQQNRLTEPTRIDALVKILDRTEALVRGFAERTSMAVDKHIGKGYINHLLSYG